MKIQLERTRTELNTKQDGLIYVQSGVLKLHDGEKLNSPEAEQYLSGFRKTLRIEPGRVRKASRYVMSPDGLTIRFEFRDEYPDTDDDFQEPLIVEVK